MGILLSKAWQALMGSRDYKIVIIGLNNAGKTTILYSLHLGEVVVTQPTIGSNVEEVTHQNLNLVCWDLGGQESLRPDWGLYYEDTQAIIMVVDSADVERLPVVKEELFQMINHADLKGARVLVFANKQVCEGTRWTCYTSHVTHDRMCPAPWTSSRSRSDYLCTRSPTTSGTCRPAAH